MQTLYLIAWCFLSQHSHFSTVSDRVIQACDLRAACSAKMTSASSFVGKAFEKYFYDFSMYDQVFHKYVSSKGQYVALRHVAFAATGLLALVNYNFPFNPPFPTIGWKGTFVCEPDKHKAMEMYKAWKAGVEYKEAAHH